ncbi:formate dehydrogenase subunit delta [Sphingobium sp. Ant17]|uniref:formate dehydrogenase subunit delta n=1 Tax=Sphingobium sp. Ant17 TaxID=1461752 RepID=UPI0004470272|nr:formate dehydrogenase subunit delta [Sphingobium sp. Ant17]EXS69765.1 formate dehydrogenase [Sphingobium sp. Ant17]
MNDEPQIMSTADRLIYMAHQIARNLETMGDAKAVEALAEHLASFWDPRMKEQIIAMVSEQPGRFSPIVAAAVARLAGTRPVPQDQATPFNAVNEAGHCDAG